MYVYMQIANVRFLDLSRTKETCKMCARMYARVCACPLTFREAGSNLVCTHWSCYRLFCMYRNLCIILRTCMHAYIHTYIHTCTHTCIKSWISMKKKLTVNTRAYIIIYSWFNLKKDNLFFEPRRPRVRSRLKKNIFWFCVQTWLLKNRAEPTQFANWVGLNPLNLPNCLYWTNTRSI